MVEILHNTGGHVTMRLEEHVEESVRLFGKPYEEVHRWLDEFAHSKEYGMRHRRVRHHLEGLRQAERLFGKDAVPVVRQHIVSDLDIEN